MSFEYLIALLFGSNLLDIYPDIKGSRWESVLLDCVNNAERADWRNVFDEVVKIGDVEGTSLFAKYCIKNPKDLEGALFNIARRTDYTKKALIVKILIDSGVNVNTRDREETPLHAVAHRWGFDIAKILLENGADVNARDEYQRTSLHLASIFGSPNLIKLLIDNGANVNAVDNRRETPLHKIVYFSDKDDLARALLENANNIDLEIKNIDGNTPLKAALGYYSPKIAKQIIDHGANISELDENGNDLLHRVINNLDTYGESKLIVMKALIDRGMDVNSRNNDGDTCLHLTRQFWVGKKVADFLIRNGADINAKNKNGTLPHEHFDGHELKMLTFFADLKKDAAKAINESGIDVNAIDGEKRTTLYWAVSWNQTDAVRILIENGADVINTDYGQYIPIIYAGYRGNSAIARNLVEHGVDVNSRIDDMTALSLAAEKGYAYFVRTLIELGADINIRTYREETPLHAAIFKGHIDVVRVLIEMGANLDAKNKDEETPLDFCRRWDKKEIAAILREAKKKQKKTER